MAVAPDQIGDRYRQLERLIDDYRALSLAQAASQLDRDEINSEVNKSILFLEEAFRLQALAAIEATLRNDMKARQRSAKHLPTVKAFRNLWTTSNSDMKNVRLDGILDIWAAEKGCKKPTSTLRSYFKHRHWLAHGQYWKEKSGVSPRIVDVLELNENLTVAIQQVCADYPLSP